MENSDATLVACQPRMRSCGSRGWETWHGDWLRYSCVWWEQVLQWRGQSRGSNAETPAIHTLCLIPRTGATGHKGFSAKSEIKRGFNTEFYYQHQVTGRLWDREDVFTTLHKHCTVSPLELQPKNGRASLDASL